jgi:hypothetical protein
MLYSLAISNFLFVEQVIEWVCLKRVQGHQINSLQIGDMLLANPAHEPMEGAVAAVGERLVRQATRRRGKGKSNDIFFKGHCVPSGGLTLIVGTQKWGFFCKVQRRPLRTSS